MNVIADRFLVCTPDAAIDLASGDRVALVTSTAGGVAEQAQWAARCERFARWHHRSVARLVDYGPFGEGRRFEAWRSNGRWRGSAHESDHVRAHVQELFTACALSGGTMPVDAIHDDRGRARIVPAADAGFEKPRVESAGHSGEPTTCCAVLGLHEIPRPSLLSIAQLFSDRHHEPCTTVAVYGPPNSGVRTVTMTLARAARLNGYVPIASHLVRSSIAPLVDGRSVALFIRGDVARGWLAFLELGLLARRPPIAVFVGDQLPRGVCHVNLERLSASALENAVIPQQVSASLRRRIRSAAQRSRGLPARFGALLRGQQNMDDSVEKCREFRVAEPAAQYGGAQAPLATERGRLVEWPAPADLVHLRKRLQAGVALSEQGRHAAGDRTLRQVSASLARRQDWEHAARASTALAHSFLRRGRAQDAYDALIEARDAAAREDHHELLHRIAVLTGVALTDLGRLDEAEVVCTTAAAAANGLDDATACHAAWLALARCQFWRGRFDAAADTLKKMVVATLDDDDRVRSDVLRSRVAVAQGEFEIAVGKASAAVERAEHTVRPDLIALAKRATAFAHLAVADHAAVARDVGSALSAARASHSALDGLRARLLAAESHRRQGRQGPGLALWTRVKRLHPASLPALVRAQVDLLGDLLRAAGTDETDIVQRHCRTSGLGGLVTFGPVRSPLVQNAAAIADIVGILQCCQTADEDSRVLESVCSRIRERQRATGVAFFAEEGGTFTVIAADGSRVEPALAARVAALDQPIAPHIASGRLEAGAPVRYAGRRLGVLLARWTFGAATPNDVVMLLATAATAAAPALAAVVGRRSASNHRVSELIGISPGAASVRDAVERAAPAPFSVLIEGESGTGKELVARALHRQSPRRDRPFCTLNCAALPEDLVESELFGHSRGAFTGALAERPGVFEEAHSGTLFLDEIGELSPRAQAKVLRTVQESELRRVGENIPRRVDVRLVAATNRNLRQEVAASRFRLDLLYRLDVIRITLPPLRDRRDDIPLLAEHFWREATARMGSRATLSLTTLAALARYDWPGNVRELQNVLAALAVRTPRRGVVPPSALPLHVNAAIVSECSRLEAARRTFDEQFIRAALVRTGGHRGRAAQELGVTRQGLTKLMARLGLNNPGPDVLV